MMTEVFDGALNEKMRFAVVVVGTWKHEGIVDDAIVTWLFVDVYLVLAANLSEL